MSRNNGSQDNKRDRCVPNNFVPLAWRFPISRTIACPSARFLSCAQFPLHISARYLRCIYIEKESTNVLRELLEKSGKAIWHPGISGFSPPITFHSFGDIVNKVPRKTLSIEPFPGRTERLQRLTKVVGLCAAHDFSEFAFGVRV